ncbi:MAG: ABC transporter permease [Puniceicoccales bacterium]|jgi:ABC-2 type transport system permease protein|nr:ABC transporter permease [Puniceicoccales bacterium]
MNTVLTLLSSECKKMLCHASTYFITALFLVLMGFNYLYILFFYSRNTMEISTLQSFFGIFWLPTLCIVPLLTMKSFAEERRLGLLESLLSTPVSVHSLVISKFLSIYGLYVILWALSLIFPYFANYWLRQDLVTPLVTMQALLGGSIFIAITSCLFVSLGLFASSVTKSQTVASLLCFGFLFACFTGFRMLSEYISFQEWGIYVDFFRTLEDLCNGIFDLRPCLFFTGSGMLILALTAIVIEQKSLR